MAFPESIDLSTLDGTKGFQLNGVGARDGAGFSVASAGDVNGDGYNDLFIGASYADVHSVDVGAGYVVFGKSTGFDGSLELSTLDGTDGFKLSGIADRDTTGWSVASAGDVNGDGIADLIIGAVAAGGTARGTSYVVFGKTAGFSANVELSSLNGSDGFRLSSDSATGGRVGNSVASAGDVNGDGFDDMEAGLSEMLKTTCSTAGWARTC